MPAEDALAETLSAMDRRRDVERAEGFAGIDRLLDEMAERVGPRGEHDPRAFLYDEDESPAGAATTR